MSDEQRLFAAQLPVVAGCGMVLIVVVDPALLLPLLLALSM